MSREHLIVRIAIMTLLLQTVGVTVTLHCGNMIAMIAVL